jgi:hypothetical protein
VEAIRKSWAAWRHLRLSELFSPVTILFYYCPGNTHAIYRFAADKKEHFGTNVSRLISMPFLRPSSVYYSRILQ